MRVGALCRVVRSQARVDGAGGQAHRQAAEGHNEGQDAHDEPDVHSTVRRLLLLLVAREHAADETQKP
jgi:hypothetical protein